MWKGGVVGEGVIWRMEENEEIVESISFCLKMTLLIMNVFEIECALWSIEN